MLFYRSRAEVERALEQSRKRGAALTSHVRPRRSQVYSVRSASDPTIQYQVTLPPAREHCTCPHFAKLNAYRAPHLAPARCKHIWAALYALEEEIA